MGNKAVTLETLSETLNSSIEKLNQRFDKVDERLGKVDDEVRGLGVMMEAMDDKFTLMSEAQDVIREVLETKVAHIEEVLEIKATV